jgi:plastocyanin
VKRVIGLVIGLMAVHGLLFAGPPSSAATVHRIVIAKMAFGPSPSDIRPGDTIEWVNEDIFLHSVTAQDDSFDVDIAPKASARVTVTKAGMIRYTCKYHPGMSGLLVIGDKAPKPAGAAR